MAHSRLGSLLVKEGLLTESDRRTVHQISGQGGAAFARGILAMGLMGERELAAFLAEKTRFKVAPKDLFKESNQQVWTIFDPPLLEFLEVFPLKKEGSKVHVAMVDPLDLETINQLEFFSDLKVHPVIAIQSQIRDCLRRMIQRYEPRESRLENFISNHAPSASRRLSIRENITLPKDLAQQIEALHAATAHLPLKSQMRMITAQDAQNAYANTSTLNARSSSQPVMDEGFDQVEFVDDDSQSKNTASLDTSDLEDAEESIVAGPLPAGVSVPNIDLSKLGEGEELGDFDLSSEDASLNDLTLDDPASTEPASADDISLTDLGSIDESPLDALGLESLPNDDQGQDPLASEDLVDTSSLDGDLEIPSEDPSTAVVLENALGDTEDPTSDTRLLDLDTISTENDAASLATSDDLDVVSSLVQDQIEPHSPEMAETLDMESELLGEEIPSLEETPSVTTVDETSASEDIPSLEETPPLAVDETSDSEDTPSLEETPPLAVDENSALEDIPSLEETPPLEVDDSSALEDIPSLEESPPLAAQEISAFDEFPLIDGPEDTLSAAPPLQDPIEDSPETDQERVQENLKEPSLADDLERDQMIAEEKVQEPSLADDLELGQTIGDIDISNLDHEPQMLPAANNLADDSLPTETLEEPQVDLPLEGGAPGDEESDPLLALDFLNETSPLTMASINEATMALSLALSRGQALEKIKSHLETWKFLQGQFGIRKEGGFKNAGFWAIDPKTNTCVFPPAEQSTPLPPEVEASLDRFHEGLHRIKDLKIKPTGPKTKPYPWLSQDTELWLGRRPIMADKEIVFMVVTSGSIIDQTDLFESLTDIFIRLARLP